MKTSLVLMLLALPLAASADTVTRCTSPEGAVTWTNVGCDPGDHVQQVEVKPTATDSSELRNWARRSPAMRQASEVRPAPARKSSGRERVRDVVACENAQRAWEFEASKRQGKRNLGPWREQVRRACGTS